MLHSTPRILPLALGLSALIGTETQAQSHQITAAGATTATPPQPRVWDDVSPSWLSATYPMTVNFQPGSPDRILLGTSTEGLCNSIDHGVTWTREYNDFYIADDIPSWWITDVAFNPANAMEAVAVTMSGSYRSSNGGSSWTRHPGPLMPTSSQQIVNSPDGTKAMASEFFGSLFRYDWATGVWENELVVHYGAGLFEMSFDQSVPSRLYIGSGLLKMVVSPDLGNTYYSFSEGLPTSVLHLVADPEIPDRVLAAAGSELYVKPEAKSRRPVWFPHGSGLPGTTIHTLIHDPLDANRMFVGTQEEGVYVSADRGFTWRPMTRHGLDHLNVVNVAINPENPSFLLAASHSAGNPAGSGLYRIRIR